MSVNDDVKIYVKNIKKRLLYNTKESKQYLKNLETNIMEYIDEFQVTDISEIKSRFGSEEEVANAFFETVDLMTIKKKINIKRIIAVFCVAIITFWGIVVTIAAINAYYDDMSYRVDNSLYEESVSLSDT